VIFPSPSNEIATHKELSVTVFPRLAAVCQVHAVTHLLTFNTRHFDRLTPFIPSLSVVDPATV